MSEDHQLLRQYLEEGSETAFTELVRRHINLVYFTALRRVGGDRPLAEDIAQTVFCDLARKAASLQGRATLIGWLYTSTWFAAAQGVRAASRRRAREQEAHSMQELHSTSPVDWDILQPVIDEAMDELTETDREAVLLRFFAQRSYAEIGTRFSLNAEAARMRVDRALEKLRRALARRKIVSTGTALAAAFAGQAAMAAPVGVASQIAQNALMQGGRWAAAGSGVSSGSLGVGKILAGGALALLAGGLLVHFHQAKQPTAQVVVAAPPPATEGNGPASAISTSQAPSAPPQVMPKSSAPVAARRILVSEATTTIEFDEDPLPPPDRLLARLDAIVSLSPAQTGVAQAVFQEESASFASVAADSPALALGYRREYAKLARREIWTLLTPDQRAIWSSVPQEQGGGQGSAEALGQ